ncbi:hypothetical protein [Pseudomonas sp. NA-150]|uniref:hypothetical protein n=1 Tax=Pseudomonas sp. NA-150 TaxID=3367525 RepID=UPI0037C8B0B4
MKISDGFDARRLRPKGPRNWRMRFGAMIAALLAAGGILLAMAGIASLIGHPPALGDLNASAGGAAVVIVLGVVIAYLGVWLWRLCRRGLRRRNELNMAPHLMKKHD